MPAVHLKIYGADGDYNSENSDFVEASNKRVMEMNDNEISDLLTARIKEKQKAVHGGNKYSTEGAVAKQVAERSKADENIANALVAVTIAGDNNPFAEVIRLDEYTTDTFSDKLVVMYKATGQDCWGCLAGGMRFPWCLDRYIKFKFLDEDSFEFLVERVMAYDGTDGNCIVDLQVIEDDRD